MKKIVEIKDLEITDDNTRTAINILESKIKRIERLLECWEKNPFDDEEEEFIWH